MLTRLIMDLQSEQDSETGKEHNIKAVKYLLSIILKFIEDINFPDFELFENALSNVISPKNIKLLSPFQNHVKSSLLRLWININLRYSKEQKCILYNNNNNKNDKISFILIQLINDQNILDLLTEAFPKITKWNILVGDLSKVIFTQKYEKKEFLIVPIFQILIRELERRNSDQKISLRTFLLILDYMLTGYKNIKMHMIELLITYLNKNSFAINPSINRILCIFILCPINFQSLTDFITLINEIRSLSILKQLITKIINSIDITNFKVDLESIINLIKKSNSKFQQTLFLYYMPLIVQFCWKFSPFDQSLIQLFISKVEFDGMIHGNITTTVYKDLRNIDELINSNKKYFIFPTSQEIIYILTFLSIYLRKPTSLIDYLLSKLKKLYTGSDFIDIVFPSLVYALKFNCDMYIYHSLFKQAISSIVKKEKNYFIIDAQINNLISSNCPQILVLGLTLKTELAIFLNNTKYFKKIKELFDHFSQARNRELNTLLIKLITNISRNNPAQCFIFFDFLKPYLELKNANPKIEEMFGLKYSLEIILNICNEEKEYYLPFIEIFKTYCKKMINLLFSLNWQNQGLQEYYIGSVSNLIKIWKCDNEITIKKVLELEEETAKQQNLELIKLIKELNDMVSYHINTCFNIIKLCPDACIEYLCGVIQYYLEKLSPKIEDKQKLVALIDECIKFKITSIGKLVAKIINFELEYVLEVNTGIIGLDHPHQKNHSNLLIDAKEMKQNLFILYFGKYFMDPNYLVLSLNLLKYIHWNNIAKINVESFSDKLVAIMESREFKFPDDFFDAIENNCITNNYCFRFIYKILISDIILQNLFNDFISRSFNSSIVKIINFIKEKINPEISTSLMQRYLTFLFNNIHKLPSISILKELKLLKCNQQEKSMIFKLINERKLTTLLKDKNRVNVRLFFLIKELSKLI